MVTFLPSSASATIQISPLEVGTNLTISAPSSATEGAQFQVTGILTRIDSGAGLGGETIDFTYNGTILGNATTNPDGTYQFTTQISETGSFTLTAEFKGSTRPGLIFKPSKATTKVATLLETYLLPIAIITIAGLLYILSRR